MGLSSSITGGLLEALVRLLDGAVCTVIEETLEVRPTVRHAELDGVRAALAGVQRELAARDGELHALRQATDAMASGLDDELELLFGGEADDLFERTEERLAGFDRQVRQLSGGLDELAARLHDPAPPSRDLPAA
ncbi:MAG: hypothetical protein H6732_13910 [Alphaproteobacteria bacterium]|nr:hypothetical protein [Alphaproteobacteria bacterium]